MCVEFPYICEINTTVMETKVVGKNTSRFDARISSEQKLELERAARLGGYRSLSEFVIASAQEKARKIIFDTESIVASQRDAELFFDSLVEAGRPNEALLNAARKYKQLNAE